MPDPGPGPMPRVCRPALSNITERCLPAPPRAINDSDFIEVMKPPEAVEPKGNVFAKSCDLPDAVFNHPTGFVPTDHVKKYGDLVLLGGRELDGSGYLRLKKIGTGAALQGIGSLALRGPAVTSAAASCGGLCAAAAAGALTTETGVSAAGALIGEVITGGVAAGGLIGLLALLWPSSLGDSSLYPEDQLRTMSQARTRVRLRVEEQGDGTLKGYGYYTGNNRDWEMISVVQFELRGTQQVADFGGGVELIWTPATDPNATLGIPALESAPQTPNIWIFPPTDAADSIIVNPLYPPEYKDFILVFPADSGIKPLYIVMSVRDEPGTASGQGQDITGIWLAAAASGLGAPIPSRIADQLNGKQFDRFSDFRSAFWLAVGNDGELAKQFSPSNLGKMLKGRAPFARNSECNGKNSRYEIHHIEQIQHGGAVYDADNLTVVTPKRHVEIHREERL